ncbi:type II toxin-antitoxin system RelE/ParE family toxin [Pseudomonas californiensis]|uniref:type II toxin-antitoxin system RelE/ParE family toxin n=1 Tax=Pseudomonas californiensis TaxID=2829823 RepID=UPI001E491349|nr:type II toxin-antitoxin system RelE/ParE family toxin [Pseudomonas californiensis]
MLRLTRKASDDLDNIFEHYKGLVGIEQAKTIVHDVVTESKVLDGSLRVDSRPTEVASVRELELKRWPFLTTYHVTSGAIEILRFLHLNGQPINQSVYREPITVVASDVDVSDLRCYDKLINGLTYRVPRCINREGNCNTWMVRIVRDKQVVLQERFSDAAFGGTLRALEAAVIHLKHSGHMRLGCEVLQLDERAVVHWRKRSGAGLCAVSYVSSNKQDRGETFFVSTYKRVESGKGIEKLRAKLIETLVCSYRMEHGDSAITEATRITLSRKVDQLLQGDDFRMFLASGKKKADQIAIDAYKSALA